MFEKIKSTYDSMFNGSKKLFTVKRSAVADALENEINLLVYEVTPSITSIIAAIEDGRIDKKLIENDPILTDIRKSLEGSVKNNLKLLEVFVTITTNIQNNQNKIENMVTKTMPTTTTDKTVTIRELGAMKVLNDIIVFRGYLEDLSLYIAASTNPEVTIHKSAMNRIKNNTGNFAEAIDQLTANALEKTLSSVPKISGTVVSDVISAFINGVGDITSSVGDTFNVFGSGFIGNPIYHIRMWLADKDHKTYEKNKANKQIIELILIDLRKKMNGIHDKDLEKQIKYYENKIYSIEHDIAKYESGK